MFLCVPRMVGSYEALQGGLTSEALTDFTGGITERIVIKDETIKNLFKTCYKAHRKGALMGCSIDVSTAFITGNRPLQDFPRGGPDRTIRNLILGRGFLVRAVIEVLHNSLGEGDSLSQQRIADGHNEKPSLHTTNDDIIFLTFLVLDAKQSKANYVLFLMSILNSFTKVSFVRTTLAKNTSPPEALNFCTQDSPLDRKSVV